MLKAIVRLLILSILPPPILRCPRTSLYFPNFGFRSWRFEILPIIIISFPYIDLSILRFIAIQPGQPFPLSELTLLMRLRLICHRHGCKHLGNRASGAAFP